MVIDYQCLADRWRRFTQVDECPDCGGDHYLISWRQYWYAGKSGPSYWHYRCADTRCGFIWYDPDKGPSVKEPRLALNKSSAFESGT